MDQDGARTPRVNRAVVALATEGVASHRGAMLLPALLLASPTVADPAVRPCIPIAAPGTGKPTGTLDDHRALRAALGESMPDDRTMVTVYGKGGHLATHEFSIVVARARDGIWHGTAVGRSKIWVEGAAYSPMPKTTWTLDTARGHALDRAIACHYRYVPPKTPNPGPPPYGYIVHQIAVVRDGKVVDAFYADDGGGPIDALVLPPEG